MTKIQNKILCGKSHSGNKNLTKTARHGWECNGCGHIYTTLELDKARVGNLAGRGLPYITSSAN